MDIGHYFIFYIFFNYSFHRSDIFSIYIKVMVRKEGSTKLVKCYFSVTMVFEEVKGESEMLNM